MQEVCCIDKMAVGSSTGKTSANVMHRVLIGTLHGLPWANLRSELCAGSPLIVHVLTNAILDVVMCTMSE